MNDAVAANANDHGADAVSATERRPFGSIFLVWLNFQLSTVMLFFGGVTVAHLPFHVAVGVVLAAAALISGVSLGTSYLGAKTGLSTALLCERAFGRRGGTIAQVFQVVIEFGWFTVIVGLTGEAASALLQVSSPTAKAFTTLAVGALYVLSVLFGFAGLRLLSSVAAPVVVGLLALILWRHFGSTGLLWKPQSGSLSVFQAISVATGTFITGAALSADIARYARTPRAGAAAGVLSFALSIPFQLLLGAAVAMTNRTGPDFVAAVAASSVGWIVLSFVVVANCIGDATLYLAVVPLGRLVSVPRFLLVLLIGAGGSLIAAGGVSQLIVGWLGTLSVLLPPLAGPLLWFARRLFTHGTIPDAAPGIAPSFLGWLVGAVAGGVAEFAGVGLAPVFGIVISYFVCVLISRWHDSTTTQ